MTAPGLPQKLRRRAAALVDYLAKQCNFGNGFGSFSSVAYDIAWVSMVQKEEKGVKLWRFPECFQYLLDTQGTDGAWRSGTVVDETDTMLNSMVALLAFKKHITEPSNCAIPHDMDQRTHKAKVLVQSKMNTWDVESSEHVGFEILVPTLLRLLESEGICFEIPKLPVLMALNTKKLGKLDLQLLYGPTRDTLFQSLEAFIGRIDFDKLSHHKVSGSMMCSPSSTAAYLMHSSRWDEEAEEYLSNVIVCGSGKGSGGVPSAFPTPIFELSWVLSTLFLSGFTADQLGLENVTRIGDFLDGYLQAGHELVGFAPDLLPDADDTAKTILSLNLIGRSASAAKMLAEFEADGHFKTYTRERNPSFSANCNVLCSLLYTMDPDAYVGQISKAATFIRDCCWEGALKDKWNISSQYSAMLACQVLMRLLRVWNDGQLSALPDNFFRDQVPIILFQIMPLPWATCMRDKVEAAITSGRLFLCQSLDTIIRPEPIWIEKVLYGSSVLCETYILAAINAPLVDHSWGEAALGLTNVAASSVEKSLQFFTQLPLFAQEPRWRLQASLTEGYLFLPRLKKKSREIFPRDAMAEDKYLEYIPLTWTTTNILKESYLSASMLQEMMVISMLNYQADEYMEAVVGRHYTHELEPIKYIIREVCEEPGKMAKDFDGLASKKMDFHDQVPTKENPLISPENSMFLGNGILDLANGRDCPDKLDTDKGSLATTNTIHDQSSASMNTTGVQEARNEAGAMYSSKTLSLDTLKHRLDQFVKYVLCHPRVATASIRDQATLKQEIEIFLLAHVTQIEDNLKFSQQDLSISMTVPFLSPQITYHRWVHTTSADHTSCPYSFAFFHCLISSGESDCFEDIRSKYLAQDLCSHLAVMCRQYNDYGSVARDRTEGNLNSINFPEFHPTEAHIEGQQNENKLQGKEDALKSALFEIAEYERESLVRASQCLKKFVSTEMAKMLDLFVGVTDLYGQIYVAKDIASRMS